MHLLTDDWDLFQGKQVYAEKRLERLRAAEAAAAAAHAKMIEGAVSNGTVANGHTNGYTNGVSKRKTQ